MAAPASGKCSVCAGSGKMPDGKVQYRFLNFGAKICRIKPIEGGQSFLAPTHELFHDVEHIQRITRESIVVRA